MDPQLRQSHTPRLDCNGKKQRQTCLGFGKVFVEGVTVLAPVIVVGPVYNGRLEERVWVCLEHWEKSVIDENKGDDDCEVAALEEESQEFFDVSPVMNRTRCNKGLTRKKLEFGSGPS